MENTVYDLILGALDHLSADQLERFKDKLSARQEIGYGLIEKESNMAVTKRIIEKFTTKNAIAHTAKVLEEIGLNNQAEKLVEAYALKEVHILEPRTRKDFLQYSCQLTLDPNTAHRELRLSEGNRENEQDSDSRPVDPHPAGIVPDPAG
ncbi:hypothetical protein AAFF_G00271820 [Aldrovandia affinis]|uniref:Pyrin domain-containing protein n=1 Tax=Aldrovandia affinis TaxID=143900 RepID=A0AAD7W2Q8_9TELE|nr:hypothetical protein AAFF_G00271820 [Aldrovandia affinis]